MSRRWIAGIAAVAALVVPAQAEAAIDVSTIGNELRIEETNNILNTSVSYLFGPVQFQIAEGGAGAATTSDPDCETNGSSIVECDDNGEDLVVVDFGTTGGFINLQGLSSLIPNRFSSEITLGNASDIVDGTDGADEVTAPSISTVNGDTIDTYEGNDDITTGNGSDLINGGDDADVIVANGGNNIVNGGEFADDFTDGADDITGGSVQDDLDGGAGTDTINGGDDNDEITGGDDNDIINAGPGNDGASVQVVQGGDGNDTINGEAGLDELEGGDDTDTLNGGNDDDTLNGGAGTDTLNGDADEDLLLNSDGPDTFNGGANAAPGDEVDYTPTTASAAMTIDIDGIADDGRNCPGGSCENDNVTTSVENVTGDGSVDTITGSSAANVLDGAAGNDTLAGGSSAGGDGADRFIGGSGTGDLVTYAARTGAIVADIDGVADDAGEADDVELDVEDLTGGSGADNLTGSASVNALRGGSGTANDTLSGSGESDLLLGGTGANTGPDGADVFNGGTNGVAGDSVSYAGRADVITADLDGNPDDGAAGELDDVNADVENLTGGTAGDTLTGSNGGDNAIDGGGGSDDLAGGTGTADDGSDTFTGGTGSDDEVSYASRTGDLDIDLDGAADDGLAGELDNVGTTVENVTGGAGDDDLTGNSSANELTGNGADDDLKGGISAGADGADVFAGGNGSTVGGQNGFTGDEVDYEDRTSAVNISIGGAADGATGENDSIGADIEILSAGAGADTLTGSSAPGVAGEFFFGRGGNDTMSGGTDTGPDGIDRFIGGSEIDSVAYSTRTDAITAVIDDPGVISPPATTDNDDITSDIENVFGGTASDTLIGNDGDNQLSGQGGDDTLIGGQAGVDGEDEYVGGVNGAAGDTVSFAHRGDDVVADIGGGDDDVDLDDVQPTVENMTGGGGDDTLLGGSGANRLDGGAGDDNLAGGQGTGPDGADTFIGGTDGTPGGAHFEFEDLVTYFSRTDDVSANLTTGVGGATGEADVIDPTMERATGGAGDDTLTGDAEANLLEGNAGDDTFAGGQGTGPDGADTFNAGPQGTAGDTVTYATRTDVIAATIGGAADVDGDDVQSQIDNLTGGSNNDTLTGDADANRLEGGDGEDALSALAGIDRLEARDGFADTVDCGTQADTAVVDEGTLDTVNVDCETLDQPPLLAPETTILTGPDNPTPKKTAKFTFEANEAATFECKIDQKPLRPCTSPTRFRNLDPGRHKVTVVATDLVGQVDATPAKYRWRITN